MNIWNNLFPVFRSLSGGSNVRSALNPLLNYSLALTFSQPTSALHYYPQSLLNPPKPLPAADFSRTE
jgi:hypothetical protein